MRLVGSLSLKLFSPECDPPWQLVAGGCYFMIVNKLTWLEAADMCEVKGGHLVEIETQQEQNALVTGFTEFLEGKSFSSMRVWIGLVEKDTGSEFVWDISGTHARWQFTSWRSEEESTDNENNCVAIPVSNNLDGDNNGKWVDKDCNEEFKALCEKGMFLLF